MPNRDGFRIVFGDTWHAPGGAALAGAPAGAHGGIDFSRVRDVVDIVVDGASISRRAEEDSIFFLVRDLLFAVEKLSAGDGTTRVSFYEGPFELALQRLGRDVFLTFFRGGKRPEVVVKDQRVSLKQLAAGVLASARQLFLQAIEVDPRAAEDPTVAGMRVVEQRLADWMSRAAAPEEAPAREPVRVESTRWKVPRNDTGFSFGFAFAATVTDLLAPGKPQGSDLKALLVRGQYVAHARGRRLALGEGYLFLQTERLLASLRQLLAAWEEGRPMSVRMISDGLVVGLRLGSDDGLVVTLMNGSRDDAVIALNDLSPWEYADAVLGAARELRRLFVEQNPAQRRNLRLEALSREVRALTAWSKEQRRGAVINADPERYRRTAEQRRPDTAIQALGGTSRLRFGERWRLEVEGLDLGGTALFGEQAVVGAKGAILGVDTTSGAVIWRRDTDLADARFQVVPPDGIVRVAPSGQVDMIDLFSGVLRWRTTLAPRSGGSPVVLVSEQGPAPGLVIAAEEERRIVALDLRTGEPRWRFAASRGGAFALRRFGRLLYVASSDSHFNAIDLEDGGLVWRFADRTRFLTPPALSGDTLIAVGGRPGRPEGRIYALNAFSGEPIWSAPLAGGAVTPPIAAGHVVLVPIRSGRRHELTAFDIPTGKELWRKDCAGWADPCALMALDNAFVVNSAGGVIRAVGARDGVERWTTVLGPTCSDDVPLSLKVVLRGGMLFVPADTVYVVRPEDGHVIYSLGGEPPVPDLLQVDPTCAVFIAEESGHIAMYNLESRLSVVS